MKKIKNIGLAIVMLVIVFMYSCENATKTTPAETSGIESHTEFNDVKSAIEDYVLGLYEADSTRIERSVDSTLRKIGYWFNDKTKEYYDNSEMTYARLVGLSSRWNAKGDKANEDSPKDIVIYDINDKSASAKLTAEWGIDYFHLAKVNNKWMIMNILWQSPPR